MVENRSRRAPAPICVQRPRGPKSLGQGRQTACAGAPSLADTLADCARPPAQSHLRFSMVENRSRRPPAPICMQRPRGPKSRGPVTACPVAPSFSATLPDRAPAPSSTADPVYRWSKIGRVARPHQYACNDRGGRNLEVRQPARPVAPSLSATLANRAPARASTADPVYRWSKIGRVARPHQYACNDRGGRNLEVRQPACQVAPSLSATPPDRAPARASTADPVYRWSKIGRVARPRQYACNDRGGRNPKVR
jgi:putative hemolysin